MALPLAAPSLRTDGPRAVGITAAFGAVIVVGAAGAAKLASGAASICVSAGIRTKLLCRTAKVAPRRTAVAATGTAAIDQTAAIAKVTALPTLIRVADTLRWGNPTGARISLATQLFAVTGAKAAVLVTAFGVGGPDPSRIAAIWTAFFGTRGRWHQAEALPTLRRLLAGAANRSGGRGWTTGRLRVSLQDGAADRSRTAEAEEPLEH